MIMSEEAFWLEAITLREHLFSRGVKKGKVNFGTRRTGADLDRYQTAVFFILL
jgi:hypothetical protein